jgi:hypothetical protein
MKHVLYESAGNTLGLEYDMQYWEIGEDGYVERAICVQEDGKLLKYDRSHQADWWGQLPEGTISEENLLDVSYGRVTRLSVEEFELKWAQKAENYN